MSAQERIAEVLNQHVWIEHGCECSCGERDEPNTRMWDYTERQWAAHAASAVLAALCTDEPCTNRDHWELR